LGTRIVQATSERPLEFESGSPLESLGRFWFAVERSSSPEYAALHEFNDAWESYARDLVGFVDRVERIQDDLTLAPKEFEKYADVCADRFGEDWRGFDSDWSALTEYVDSGDHIASAVRSIFTNEERVARYLQALGKIWNRENVEKGAFGTVLREFCESWTSCLSNLLEIAPDFNAWKDVCQRQDEIIRLESSIIGERFGSYEPSEWERVAEAGNEIANQVGKLFSDPATRETFLKKVDEFWQALNEENSEDVLLLDAFLANWKTYEETSEKFFNSLDELCPETSAFEAEAATFDVSKIDLTNLAASLVRHADAFSRFKRCEDKIGAFSSLAIKNGKYDRLSAERVQRVVERIDELAKSVSSSASQFERVPFLTDDSPFFEVDSFDLERLNRMRDMIGAILERSEKPEEFGAQAQTLENAFERLQDSSRRLKNLLKFDSRFDDATFADAELDFASRILRAENELRLWIDWNQVKSKASLEFPKLLELIERRKIENSQIADVVRYVLYDQFADDVVDSTSALKEFIQRSNGREQKIERFKQLDREYSSLSQRLVVAKLTKKLPTRRNEEAPRETELGKLRREINAKRHAKSVRTILGDIPTLLPKLKPCLLASPLSVAQYFPPDGEKYDLVIFDEASQIPVWDAIGAVARGKRLIVVGDSKQLPPTSFFQRAASEDEDELNEFSEPESVLDECVGAQIPEIQLRWHYRSRREGLIAFSNSRYYDDKLYTFPSVDRTNSGVRFVYVEKGRYDRGGSKTNQVEARALVDEVVRRLSNPDFAGKSLGIVTFNEAQKNAIEDLLDEERRNRPEMEPFFSADYFEPVFVKNLENVQGDERDVMYFSICYGPDARGVVSNNFGPLNKSGGERRLNVAITRAKEENVVFSSIRASDLKLTSVSSERRGARDLKEFLDYAESGGVRLTTIATTNSEYDADASFEEEIAKFLRSKDYIVKTRVGRSKCRVDLAIVAPDAPDEYVVGIECDGTAYRSSSTTRDRDLLRQSVLEGLGWRVVRVWSTSWAYDRANAEKKLLKDLEDAFNDRRLKRLERESQICDVVQSDSEPPTRYESSLDDATKFESVASSVVDSRDAFVRDYPSLAYLDEKIFQNDGAFYDNKNLRSIKRQLARIVEVESPITESLILERIKRVWQISRAGTQIKGVVQSCLRNVAQTKQSDGTRVYWSSKEAPSTFLFYRSGGDRKFSDIPLQEFFNAVDRVKAEYGDFTDDDGLYREALKRFDVQRLTQSIKATIEREARKR